MVKWWDHQCMHWFVSTKFEKSTSTMVYKTFFQQYLDANHLQEAQNMLYGNNYQENPQNFFHDKNTLLFVMNSNTTHWN